MIKLLHIADVHLGTKFNTREKDVRKKLRKAVLNSFEKSVNFAINRDIDLFIIAGDLFDSWNLGYEVESTFFRLINKLIDNKIHICYITGNHDPYSVDLAMFGELSRNEYIHLFGEPFAKTIQIEGKSGQICFVIAAGHDNASIKSNIVKTFPNKTGDEIHIGIAHTMVTSIKTESKHANYMPCTLNDLKQKNYDYFALGHIHKAMDLDEDGRIRYSGNTQGRHINEAGVKGGYLVELDSEYINSQFIDFSEIHWHRLDVNVDGSTTMMDIDKTIKKVMESQDRLDKKIYRLQLKGATELYNKLIEDENKKQIEESIKAMYDIIDVKLETSDIEPLIDIDELKQGEHFVASFLNEISKNGIDIENSLKDVKFISDRVNDDISKFVESVDIENMIITRIKK